MEIIPDEIYVQVDLKEYDKKGLGKIDIEQIKQAFLNNCKQIGIADSLITINETSGTGREFFFRKRNKK